LFERALLGDQQRKKFDPREDRKTLQLCGQVRRALMLALAGECADDLLRDLFVESVEPMGSASQLLVRVSVPSSAEAPVALVLGRLNGRAGALRALVAQAICRKRVPSLSFIAAPIGGDFTEGGEL
jgi:ribosome-binding factor A